MLRYNIGSWFITKLPRSLAVTCPVLSDGSQDTAGWKPRVGCPPGEGEMHWGHPILSRSRGTEHNTKTKVGPSLSPLSSGRLPVDLMWGGEKVATCS